jgi:hypothetical protein
MELQTRAFSCLFGTFLSTEREKEKRRKLKAQESKEQTKALSETERTEKNALFMQV